MRENNSLSQKVVRGGVWVFALRIVGRIFDLIRIIILARILVPYDFGLMGIALLTMAILETFSQTGFQQALIQKKKNIETYLDAAWTILILRGVLLFVVLYLIAPYAAVFFKAPQARPIIQVIGLSLLLGAFTNMGVIYFQKELEFNKQFIYQLSGTLADFIVAVSAALILRSVWALVFGLLAAAIVRLIVSYLIHPYRPHLNLDLGKTKELFGFGKWVLGTRILVFLLLQGDDIFVGKILGAIALGFYQMAYRISNLPATEITNVVYQISFPAFSKLQDNQNNLKNGYLETLRITTLLSIPLAGGLIVLAPDFVRVVLGEKWIPIILSLQILAIWGAIRSIGSITSGSLLRAIGIPKIETKIQIARLILLAILIYPLTKFWGFVGTALAVTLSAVVIEPFVDYLGIKISKCGLKAYGKAVGIPLLSTFLMVFLIFTMKTFLPLQIGVVRFVLLIICGFFAYTISVYLLDSCCDYGIKNLIFHRILPAFKGESK